MRRQWAIRIALSLLLPFALAACRPTRRAEQAPSSYEPMVLVDADEEFMEEMEQAPSTYEYEYELFAVVGEEVDEEFMDELDQALGSHRYMLLVDTEEWEEELYEALGDQQYMLFVAAEEGSLDEGLGSDKYMLFEIEERQE